MTAAVSQVIVLVSDMTRALRFYRDALGLESVTESATWSELRAGGVSLGLHAGREPSVAGRTNGVDAGTLAICLTVPDLARTCQELRAIGIEVDGPNVLVELPPMATLYDPDGVSLVLQQA
jgi:catechol 2,3-dioxygenase-like lactoylglutathione lyase family enzyme